MNDRKVSCTMVRMQTQRIKPFSWILFDHWFVWGVKKHIQKPIGWLQISEETRLSTIRRSCSPSKRIATTLAILHRSTRCRYNRNVKLQRIESFSFCPSSTISLSHATFNTSPVAKIVHIFKQNVWITRNRFYSNFFYMVHNVIIAFKNHWHLIDAKNKHNFWTITSKNESIFLHHQVKCAWWS